MTAALERLSAIRFDALTESQKPISSRQRWVGFVVRALDEAVRLHKIVATARVAIDAAAGVAQSKDVKASLSRIARTIADGLDAGELPTPEVARLGENTFDTDAGSRLLESLEGLDLDKRLEISNALTSYLLEIYDSIYRSSKGA